MSFRFRSVALMVASAGYAHAAFAGDEKSVPLLISSTSATFSRPPLLFTPTAPAPRNTPLTAGVVPRLPTSFFGSADGGSRLLFLSPLSPLRAALRVAAQDLAAQARTALAAVQPEPEVVDDVVVEPANDATSAARRREVILRQRRKSVLNDRDRGAERNASASLFDPGFETSGFSGSVDLLTLPAGSDAGKAIADSIPNGAGLVRVSGYLTDDLSFALTGLAADSAATTWRAGAEFELAAGDRNRFEVGAVYGTRFNANRSPIGAEIDRRSVGAFRVVHALQILDGVTTRFGGRFIDAPFLAAPRSVDPEFSILVDEKQDGGSGHAYMRFDFAGDTLFPGLEVVTSGGDVIALSEGLPVFARDFNAQRTWTRSAAVGYRDPSTRVEAKLQDQIVSHALVVTPSSIAGAPSVTNGSRNRAQIASVMFEQTFAHGQAQAAIEYGYGHFAAIAGVPRTQDFHQVTSRFDAFLRRSGTGLAIFHRVHEGAAVTNYAGDARPRSRAQRYLVELRQDVPFVPESLGADMALLLSLRNVYYDDIDRRNVDEFAVAAPPRRITGGIRVKF